MFPAEAVPDSAILAPHHFTYPLFLVLWATAYRWDALTDREPWVVSLGAGVALFAFLFGWPFYPVAGALGALAGLVMAGAGLLRWRAYWGRPTLWFTAAMLALAFDDWLSHALGVWTPADWLFGAVVLGA